MDVADKRQLLNLLGIAYRYKKILEMSPEERSKVVPRVCMMGGKAFATYIQAKRIIYLANSISSTINNDPTMKDYMQVKRTSKPSGYSCYTHTHIHMYVNHKSSSICWTGGVHSQL